MQYEFYKDEDTNKNTIPKSSNFNSQIKKYDSSFSSFHQLAKDALDKKISPDLFPESKPSLSGINPSLPITAQNTVYKEKAHPIQNTQVYPSQYANRENIVNSQPKQQQTNLVTPNLKQPPVYSNPNLIQQPRINNDYGYGVTRQDVERTKEGTINGVPESVATRGLPSPVYEPQRNLTYKDNNPNSPTYGKNISVPESQLQTDREKYTHQTQAGLLPQGYSYENFVRGQELAKEAQQNPNRVYDFPKATEQANLPSYEEKQQELDKTLSQLPREEIIRSTYKDFNNLQANPFEVSKQLRSAKANITNDIKAYADIRGLRYDSNNPYQTSQVAKMMDQDDAKYGAKIADLLADAAQRSARDEKYASQADKYRARNNANLMYSDLNTRNSLIDAIGKSQYNEDGSVTVNGKTYDSASLGQFATILNEKTKESKAPTKLTTTELSEANAYTSNSVKLQKAKVALDNGIGSDGLYHLDDGTAITPNVMSKISNYITRELPKIEEHKAIKKERLETEISKLRFNIQEEEKKIAGNVYNSDQKKIALNQLDRANATLRRKFRALAELDTEGQEEVKKKITEVSEPKKTENLKAIETDNYFDYIKNHKSQFLDNQGNIVSETDITKRPQNERIALDINDKSKGNLSGITGHSYAFRASKKLGIPMSKITMGQVLDEYNSLTPESRVKENTYNQGDFESNWMTFNKKPEDLNTIQSFYSSALRGFWSDSLATTWKGLIGLTGGDIYDKSKFYNTIIDMSEEADVAESDKGFISNTLHSVTRMLPFLGTAAGVGLATGGYGVLPYFMLNGKGTLSNEMEKKGIDKDITNIASTVGGALTALVYNASMKGLAKSFGKNVEKGINKWFVDKLAKGVSKFTPTLAKATEYAGEVGLVSAQMGVVSGIQETFNQLANKLQDEWVKHDGSAKFDIPKIAESVWNGFVEAIPTMAVVSGAGKVYKKITQPKQGVDLLEKGKPLEEQVPIEQKNILQKITEDRVKSETEVKTELTDRITGNPDFKTIGQYTSEQQKSLLNIFKIVDNINEKTPNKILLTYEDVLGGIKPEEFLKLPIERQYQYAMIRSNSLYKESDIRYKLEENKNSNIFNGLISEAKKYNKFEDFKHDFLIQLKHGKYYHITDNPNFKIDSKLGPRDMSSMANGEITKNKLMITSHLENWLEQYPDRKYVAIIDMSNVNKKDYSQVNRGFGNEFWVENPNNVKVLRVIPVKEALKESKLYEKALSNSINNDADLKNLWEKAQVRDNSNLYKLEEKPTPKSEKHIIGDEEIMSEVARMHQDLTEFKKQHKGSKSEVVFKYDLPAIALTDKATGKIYINPSKVKNIKDFKETMLHEDLVHLVMDKALSEHSKNILFDHSIDFLKEVDKEHLMSPEMFNEYKDLYKNNIGKIKEEIIAHWVQSESFAKLTPLSKAGAIINNIKRWLKQVFHIEASFKDAKDLMRDLYSQYTTGKFNKQVSINKTIKEKSVEPIIDYMDTRYKLTDTQYKEARKQFEALLKETTNPSELSEVINSYSKETKLKFDDKLNLLKEKFKNVKYTEHAAKEIIFNFAKEIEYKDYKRILTAIKNVNIPFGRSINLSTRLEPVFDNFKRWNEDIVQKQYRDEYKAKVSEWKDIIDNPNSERNKNLIKTHKLTPEHLNALKEVFNSYYSNKPEIDALHKKIANSEWMSEEYLKLNDELLNSKNIYAYNSYRLKNIVADVNNIIKTGKTKQQEIDAIEKEEFNRQKEEIKQELTQRLKGKNKPHVFGFEEKSKFDKFKKIAWSGIRSERIIGWFSGKENSLLDKYVFRPLNKAKYSKHKNTEKEIESLQKDLITIDRRSFNDKAKGVTVELEYLNPTSKQIEKKPYTFTQNDIATIYLQSKNPMGYNHLLGSGLTEKSIIKITDAILPDVKKFSDNILKYINTEGWEKLNAIYKKQTGYDLPKNDNYFPLNNVQSSDLMSDANRSLSQRFSNYMNKDFLKERTGSSSSFKNFNFLDSFTKYIQDTEHYIAFNDSIKQARKILFDPEIKDLMTRISPEAYSQLREWVEANAAGKIANTDKFLGYLTTKIRTNFYIQALSGPITAFKQIPGFMQGMGRVEHKYILEGLGELATGRWEGYKNFLNNLSKEMPVREESLTREIAEINEMYGIKKFIPYSSSKIMNFFSKVKMSQNWLMTQSDKLWAGSLGYCKYKEVFAKTKNKELAIKEADDLIRQTQSIGGLVDLPAMMRGGGVSRMFTVFTNQINNIMNEVFSDFTYRYKTEGIPKVSLDLFYTIAASNFLLGILQKGFTVPDWEEWLQIAGNNTIWGSYPIINKAMDAIAYGSENLIKAVKNEKMSKKDFFVSLVPPELSSAERVLKALANANATEAAKGIAAFYGIGVLPLSKAYKGWDDFVETGDPRYLLYSSQALVEAGVKQKGKKTSSGNKLY